MLQPGNMLQGRYRIISSIGGGGQGIVYLVEDSRLPGLKCAIKEMSPAQLPAQDRNWAINAFQQEAHMLAGLQHAGLTRVTDFFPEGGNWYLVMEYVAGQPLEQVLSAATGQRLPPPQAFNVLGQLCDVLEYLHARTPPVVFRDLKPANVMLTPEGKVKLIDFGIARFFKPSQGQDTVNLGTPGYAAPEQYGGQGQSDPRADVYGLGVLLHRMLTGHDPTSTPFRLPPAESLNQDVSPQVGQAIRQATAHEPDQRFFSVADFCAALKGQTTALPPPPPDDRAVPRWLVGAVGAGAGIMLLIVVFLLGQRSSPASVQPTHTKQSSLPGAATIVVTATPEPSKTFTPAPPSPTMTMTATPDPLGAAQIVFCSGRSGNDDVYIMNADGSNTRRLTTSSGDDSFPVVSPDGRRIVFQSDRDGNWEIYLMDLDGVNQTRLTFDAAEDKLPTWSPDGRQILFNSERDGNFELYVVNADGSNTRRLTDNRRRDGHASWSSNGQIVFNAGDASNSNTWEIYVMSASGGGERQLTSNAVNDWSPNWSPDGRYVLFLSRRGGDDDPAIWMMNADGSGANLVYNNSNAYDWGAVWSPDSRYVAFTSDVAGQDEVYLLELDSGRTTRLTFDGGMYPSWVP